jgi:hypothetical protein
MNTTCWFCCQAILPGERANRSAQAGVAVHTACLRQDAVTDGARPGGDDLAAAA